MTQQQPSPHIHVNGNIPSVLRAIISILETVSFIVAGILVAVNNGQDFRHAFIAGFLGFVAHGVNHNAGGSPI